MKNDYSARYYKAPPDLPSFLYKNPRYVQNAVQQLIDWATKEYNTSLRQYAKRKEWKTVRILSNSYSGMRVLAEFPEFRSIIALIQQDAWNQLTGRQRVFLRRAFELNMLLGQ